MKTLKRMLAVVMVLCMMLTIAPLSAFADSTTETEDDFYRILHLDCGRKYFTKDWIIALINEMAAAGFNQLQLAFGNDGMRFLLDNMSVTVDGTTYSHADVKAGIQLGNTNYYDAGDVNELTQTEMTAIIAHAKLKGIEIIPHINMPGHMDAILDAIEHVGISDAHMTGYTTSARSLNLENDTAVAFAQELLAKYIGYFANQGCRFFHIGADEYGNDAYYNSMGFPSMGSTLYAKFADFVNDAAALVKAAGMTPRAWNDGISYGNGTNYNSLTNYSETFDTDIQVTYWSSGWGSGYALAPATTLHSNGHDMINTNGDYYYILGVNDCYTSGNTATHVGYDYTAAEGFSNTTFMGSTISDPVGSMFCIWADLPGAETETEVAMYVRPILRVMGARMQGSTEYEVDSIVAGGFNADGTINEDLGTLVTLADNDVSVIANNLTGFTATPLSTNPVIEGAKNIKTWNLVPETAEGKYTGAAEVKFPVPSDWNINKVFAFVVNENGTITILKGTYADGYYTVTMPHFSEGGVAETEYDKLVELEIGETSATITDNTGYYSTAEGLDKEIADVVLGGQAAATPTVSYDVVSGLTASDLISSDDSKQATGYYYLVDGEYYPVYATRTTSNNSWYSTYTYTWYYSTDNGNTFEELEEQTGSRWNDPELNITVYSKSESGATVDPYTTIQFVGISVGTTYATIGSTVYKIVVSPKTETVNLKQGNSKSYETTATTYEMTGDIVVDVTIADGVVTFVAKDDVTGTAIVTVGDTVYTVNVSEENLEEVTPLKIEFWITNGRAMSGTYGTGNNYLTISATDEGIYSVNGVSLDEIIPQYTYKEGSATSEGRKVEYWQSRLLDTILENNSSSGYEFQTLGPGDDETTSGVAFTKVRYWSGEWAVYNGTEWLPVDLTTVEAVDITSDNEQTVVERERHQLVAYYMEILQIADELEIRAADWGKMGDGTTGGDYLNPSAYCSISIQLILEDGTAVPEDVTGTGLQSQTIVFGYWNGGRGVGTIVFNQLKDYEIYRVTAETGSVSASFANNSAWETVTVNSFTWDDNAKVVWSGTPSSSVMIQNNAKYPNTEDPYDNLMWDENREAILIRVYVRSVAVEGAISVHYHDRSAHDIEFYNYTIPVVEGTVFDSGIAQVGTTNTLKNNTVINYYKKTQTVSADLQTMPEIKAYYRYCNYTLVDVVRSADGKEVHLYYTFSPVVSFLADFGLSLDLTPEDLLNNAQDSGLDADEMAKILAGIHSVKVIGTYDTAAGTTAHSEYGDLSVSGTTITYTPTEALKGVDFFSAYLVWGNTEKESISVRIYILPATTMYYEDTFATLNGFTATGSPTVSKQETQPGATAGENFGYTSEYTGKPGMSGGTAITSNKVGNSATFTFTGTGIEVYANCTTDSGVVVVAIKDTATGKYVKFYQVDTKMANGTTDATEGQSVEGYSLPIVSVQGLTYGTYEVSLMHTARSGGNPGGDVSIDGFRVFNALNNLGAQAYPTTEQNPTFVELRDQVIAGLDVTVESADSIYTTAQGILDQVYAAAGTTAGAMIIGDNKYNITTAAKLKDYLDNGPKNELFLYGKQTVIFTLAEGLTAQIGMKAVNGAVTCTINGKAYTVNTSADMFYANASGTVTISNTSESAILSITLLKVIGAETNTSIFLDTPVANMASALKAVLFAAPAEDETPDSSEENADGTIDVPATDAPVTDAPATDAPATDAPASGDTTETDAPEAEESETSSEADSSAEPEDTQSDSADTSADTDVPTTDGQTDAADGEKDSTPAAIVAAVAAAVAAIAAIVVGLLKKKR